ncbi:MAG: RNA polymerase sigma factor [Thermodesulfobacteriota bacterium]
MRETEQKTTDEDYEFVSLCKEGDVDAFEVLVRKHQKRMLNIAYRMIGNYEEACDVVQDAFISAYRSIKGFKGKAKFSTWLYTIVMNLSKNRLKQLRTQLHREKFSIDDPVLTNSGQIRGELASIGPSALESLERRDVQQKVQECINSLDEEFREVLILRDIQGFSYDEIGDVLTVPEGTVKSRLFRAREAVKDCLKKVIGDL